MTNLPLDDLQKVTDSLNSALSALDQAVIDLRNVGKLHDAGFIAIAAGSRPPSLHHLLLPGAKSS